MPFYDETYCHDSEISFDIYQDALRIVVRVYSDLEEANEYLIWEGSDERDLFDVDV